MNMHQPIHADPSPTAARLKAAYKARRAKEAAAARKVASANQNAPAVKREPEPRDVESFGTPKVSLELRTAPLWRIAKLKFDAHVTAWNDWKAEVFATQGAPLKAYIRRRSHELGFTYSDVTGPSRRQDITDARQLIMWEIKTLLRPGARGEPDFISYPEIGRLFGGRDHTTTLHAVRKIQAMKDKGQI